MSSYATFADVERFFEGFATHYYGHKDNLAGTLQIYTGSLADDLSFSFNKINIELSSVGRVPIIPVGTNVKLGQYHPHLVEWNAVDTIFNKLKSRHAVEFRDGLPEWMMSFATRANQIINDIVLGRVSLDTDTTTYGIGYPVEISRVGRGTFYTNWDSGFYWKSDYPKVFRLKIFATTSGNEIGEAEFKSSDNDGYSWSETLSLTGTTWIHLEGGLDVRWEPAGTLYGTQAQVEYGDEYQIKCIPANVKVINRHSNFRRIKRG